MTRYYAYLIAAILVSGIAGCKKAPPPATPPAPITAAKSNEPPPLPTPPTVSVTGIVLGKAIGSDKKITSETSSFNKTDPTFYATVATKGDGMATVKASWTYVSGAKPVIVAENSETVTIKGEASTLYEITRPSGWTPGDYQLEILLGGVSVGTKKFSVQ